MAKKRAAKKKQQGPSREIAINRILQEYGGSGRHVSASEISRKIKMSPVVTRDAVNVIEGMGYVMTRVGSGSYFKILNSSTYGDNKEVRLAVEIAVCYRIATEADSSYKLREAKLAHREMKSIVDKYQKNNRRISENDQTAIHDLDQRFHLRIMADNETAKEVVRKFFRESAQLIIPKSFTANVAHDLFDEHTDILAAIEADEPDFDEVEAAYHRHLRNSETRWDWKA